MVAGQQEKPTDKQQHRTFVASARGRFAISGVARGWFILRQTSFSSKNSFASRLARDFRELVSSDNKHSAALQNCDVTIATHVNDDVSLGIPGHLGQVVAKLAECGPGLGVHCPALDEQHVNVDRANVRLRQSLACKKGSLLRNKASLTRELGKLASGQPPAIVITGTAARECGYVGSTSTT